MQSLTYTFEDLLLAPSPDAAPTHRVSGSVEVDYEGENSTEFMWWISLKGMSVETQQLGGDFPAISFDPLPGSDWANRIRAALYASRFHSARIDREVQDAVEDECGPGREPWASERLDHRSAGPSNWAGW